MSAQPQAMVDENPNNVKLLAQVLRGSGFDVETAALQRAVGEYVDHYHGERNHQGWAIGCWSRSSLAAQVARSGSASDWAGY